MTAEQPLPGSSGTILVIDDEQIVVDSLKKVFEFVGWRTDVVRDVARARERIAGGGIAALVTDIMLPDESGEALLAESVLATPEMPVVMITGYGTADLALRTLAAGAFDFIPKPFSFEEMTALVVRLGRFLARPADERIGMLHGMAACPGPGHRSFCLRGHCWAGLESDGTAAVGIGTVLARTAGPVAALKLPRPGEDVAIAHHCAWLVDGDGHEHGLRAPLSGRVIDVAGEAELLASAGEEVPFRDRVFFRIRPAQFAAEAAHLVPCPTAG